MGQPTQLLQYQGCSLLCCAATIALDSVCRPVVVVLGAHRDRSVPELAGLEVAIAANPDWQQGMSTSLRVGIHTLLDLNAEVAAAVLMVCDQPFVSSALINQLFTSYLDPKTDSKSLIVAARYGDVIGVPALRDRALFPALTSLQGDMGARKIIQQYSAQVKTVPFPAGAIDIDTPADYHALQLNAVQE
jgi:molybdenum cofactor cytidylyltransferase